MEQRSSRAGLAVVPPPVASPTNPCTTPSAAPTSPSPYPSSAVWVGEILDFWFTGSLEQQFQRWFAKGEAQINLDRLITERYRHLLLAAEYQHPDQGQEQAQEQSLCDSPLWSDAPAAYAAKIILVDQFSRHIYRGNPEKIKANDKIAMRWAMELIEKGWHHFLPVNQHVFSLMPLRHSNDVTNLNIVLKHIESREATELDNTQLLDRFKKTTLHKLYDAENKNEHVDENTEILERYPFDADETLMWREKLYRCIQKFLKDLWREEMKYVVVSLSGGVDSMVISKILTKLAPVMGFTVIAIHLDYGNRPESHLEADYVQQWCKTHGIIFRKRFIHEFQRATCDRELYEQETRRIRFETYRKVLGEFNTESGVMFGHHKGDEQENVITNIMKGRESILNLSGMNAEGEIFGVKIWRPLLPYTKKYIYDFAHKYGVPYFLDTTPKWSNRGKLRNELQPMLHDMFGAGYLENLSVLGEDSTEMAILAEKYIFAPFWKKLQRSEVGVWIEVFEKRTESKLFWKHTLRHMFHSIGTSTLRDKCMGHFLKQIRVPSTKFDLGVWVSLKKENASIIYDDCEITSSSSENVTFLRKTTGPRKYHSVWRESLCTNIRRALVVGRCDLPDLKFSSMKIKLEQVPVAEFKQTEVSLFDMLERPITYYLRGSEGYCIDSNARIKAFRLIPKLVNQVVPLVVISKDSDKRDNEIETCAKVTLEWFNDEYAKEIAYQKAKQEALEARERKQRESQRMALEKKKLETTNKELKKRGQITQPQPNPETETEVETMDLSFF